MVAADPTTRPARHLQEHHNYDANGDYAGKTSIPAKRRTVTEQTQRQRQAQNSVFNRQRYKALYTTFVLAERLSLRQGSSSHLHRLITERDPVIEDALPQSATTVRSWIESYYPLAKTQVMQSLAAARSRITVSFDGWTSRSNMDLLGVIAHYISADYEQKTVLLRLAPTHGSHTGANMASTLHQTIRSFQIGSNIGFFIADGATNNDKAVELLCDSLDITPVKQRLRCAAHIINLVCNAILLGADVDCIQDALDISDDDETDAAIHRFETDVSNEQTALQAWRRKGPISKLHNIVRHVRSSPARRLFFESKQKDVNHSLPVYKLVTNGGIRWNSTHDMIARALKLKDALELYQMHFRNDPDNPLVADELLHEDWLELRKVHQLLNPMAVTSTQIQANPTEGHHGSLWQNLSVMDYLMTHLERQKQLLISLPDSHFKASVNLGWKKLDKYYSLTDDTYAYRAAIYLNPKLKHQWFIDKWNISHPAWINDVDKLMEGLFKQYQRLYPHEQRPRSHDSSNDHLTEFELYNQLGSTLSHLSEKQQYRLEPAANQKANIIHWWRDNRTKFPVLFHIAMDLLAALATTAADERLFSESDDVINNDRPRLEEEAAEYMVAIRSWMSSGVVDLTSLVEEDELDKEEGDIHLTG